MIPKGASAARVLAGLLLLCTQAEASGIDLSQSDGTLLSLDRPAARVIALAPGLAEMVYAAGAGQSLVATVEYSNFPAAARDLPRIGDAFRFDLELIMSLEPDLVLGWTTGNPAAALDRLGSLGVKVWRLEMSAPEDIIEVLEQIARATGQERPPLADALQRRLARLSRQYRDSLPVRYFYQVSPRPLFTLNGAHIVSRGLRLCGGENVFSDLAVIAPQVSVESVLVENPQAMLAPAIGADDRPLAHWAEWPRLDAVRSGALFTLPADEISRATPRFFDSLEFACTLLDRARKH